MAYTLLKNIKKIYTGSPEKESCPMSIWIKNDIIEEIAPYEVLLKKYSDQELHDSTTLDCSNLIVLPGFIDSHTHLLFSGSRENELYMRAQGHSYLEIMEKGGGIYNTVHAMQTASEDELIQNGLHYLDKALYFGTTTIEVKSGYGLSYEAEKKMLVIINKLNDLHPIDIIPTFLVHTVPRDTDRKKHISLIADKMIPEFRQYTKWFDIFIEKGVFSLDEARFLIKKAIAHGYHIGFHTNQINNIGGVQLAADCDVRHIDHLEVLTEEDIQQILSSEQLYTVFFPSAEAFVFSENVGKIQPFLSIPSRIVLSTDFNPGSSPVLSPQLIISLAVLRYRISDPFLLINAFTLNAAKMLFLNDRGIIKKGARADFNCMSLDNFEQIPYFGTLNNIHTVIKSGKLFQVNEHLKK